MSDFHVTYSEGPRYIDGVNIDLDANAGFPSKEWKKEIDEPVQEMDGRGYERALPAYEAHLGRAVPGGEE